MNKYKQPKRPIREEFKKKLSKLKVDIPLEEGIKTLMVMDQIRLGKIKLLTAEERDELERKYEVGKYRKWVYNDADVKAAEEKSKEIDGRYKIKGKKYNPSSVYTTKKSIEEDYKQKLKELYG